MAEGGGSSSSKGKKSLQRRIPLADIVDATLGSYATEDVPMLSIRTQSHTLDLQIIDDAVADTFVRSLSTVLVFLAIPVSGSKQALIAQLFYFPSNHGNTCMDFIVMQLPPNVSGVVPTEESPLGRKSAAKATVRPS